MESPLESRLDEANVVQTEEQLKMLGFDEYDRYKNDKCSDRQGWLKSKTSRARSRPEAKRSRTVFSNNMTFSRPCGYSLGVPVMFWTTVFLIFLARGVYSSDEQSRVRRSPKFDQGNDVQGGFVIPKTQETYSMMQFLRELLQRQRASQQQQQQLQVYNGEDLKDSQIDWRKIPLPLLNQIRAIIMDESKEEEKRGSYMSLCHFKICNLG